MSKWIHRSRCFTLWCSHQTVTCYSRWRCVIFASDFINQETPNQVKYYQDVVALRNSRVISQLHSSNLYFHDDLNQHNCVNKKKHFARLLLFASLSKHAGKNREKISGISFVSLPTSCHRNLVLTLQRVFFFATIASSSDVVCRIVQALRLWKWFMKLLLHDALTNLLFLLFFHIAPTALNYFFSC